MSRSIIAQSSSSVERRQRQPSCLRSAAELGHRLASLHHQREPNGDRRRSHDSFRLFSMRAITIRRGRVEEAVRPARHPGLQQQRSTVVTASPVATVEGIGEPLRIGGVADQEVAGQPDPDELDADPPGDLDRRRPPA